MASMEVMMPTHAFGPLRSLATVPQHRTGKRLHAEVPSTIKRYRADMQSAASLTLTPVTTLPSFLPTRYNADPTQYPTNFFFGARLMHEPALVNSAKVELLDPIDAEPVVLRPIKSAAKALKNGGILSIPRSLPTPSAAGALVIIDRSKLLGEQLRALAQLGRAPEPAGFDSLPDAEIVEDEDFAPSSLQSMEM